MPRRLSPDAGAIEEVLDDPLAYEDEPAQAAALRPGDETMIPTLAEAGRQLADGTVSPVELTELALSRAAALKHKLDVFIEITAATAPVPPPNVPSARYRVVAGAGRCTGSRMGSRTSTTRPGCARRRIRGCCSTTSRRPMRRRRRGSRSAGMILIGKLAAHEFATGGWPSTSRSAPVRSWPCDGAHFTCWRVVEAGLGRHAVAVGDRRAGDGV